MIYLLIFIYGILLCLGRFSGVGSTAYMPLFTLFEDPTLYPNDIYVHFSTQIQTTYFFSLLKMFGGLSSNTYFIFFLIR